MRATKTGIYFGPSGNTKLAWDSSKNNLIWNGEFFAEKLTSATLILPWTMYYMYQYEDYRMRPYEITAKAEDGSSKQIFVFGTVKI